MKMMDTRAYVGMLKELVEQGREVRMVTCGIYIILTISKIFFELCEQKRYIYFLTYFEYNYGNV